MASSIKELVLTDDDIKYIIQRDGTWVIFYNGLSDDERLKLRDSHVIDLLSNPHHVDKQKVTHINLTVCDGITDDSLIFIADNFPQLKGLSVQGCDFITDRGITAVTEKCHKLTDLNYSSCSKVGNAALEAIASNLPQLKELYAYNCNISVLPDDFGHKLKHLRVLYLQGNKISKLPASIGNLKHLEKLYLQNNNITTLPASIGNLKHLEHLGLSYNNITTLPESIGNLKHLKELTLCNNKITTLPASIVNLAGTCTNFHIDGNSLSKPLEEAANGVFQGMKQYVESKKILEEAARLNTRNNDNSESPRLHDEEPALALTLTAHTGEANEATVTSETEQVLPTTVENNPTSNTATIINDDADSDTDEARLIDSTNNDISATSLGKRSRQEKQDTTSANIPVSTVTTGRRTIPDGRQIVIKPEQSDPNNSNGHTSDDVFDQQDYKKLRDHYLEPRQRRTEGTRSLRTRYTSARIDGKTAGYEELKRQIQKLENDNDDKGIYRLLKGLRRFEVERIPISSFIRGDDKDDEDDKDDDDDDEVTEIIDLTSIPDDDAVIDVDTFIIDYLLVEVIKPDPDAVPPSGTYEDLSQQQQPRTKKVKADPDSDY